MLSRLYRALFPKLYWRNTLAYDEYLFFHHAALNERLRSGKYRTSTADEFSFMDIFPSLNDIW